MPRSLSSRGDALALYRPLRASIRAALSVAVSACRKPDFDRAAKHLGLVDQARLDGEVFEMLCDIALFEPNQRGRRVIDTVLRERIDAFALADRAVAERFRTAFFSIFRVEGRHRAAGVVLEDLLRPGSRLWLLDEGLEASAQDGLVIAMRVFEAGDFHAGFGIVVQPDDDMVQFCTSAAARGERMPVRHSLAAALYGDAVADAGPPEEVLLGLILAAANAAVAPRSRDRTPRRRR